MIPMDGARPAAVPVQNSSYAHEPNACSVESMVASAKLYKSPNALLYSDFISKKFQKIKS